MAELSKGESLRKLEAKARDFIWDESKPEHSYMTRSAGNYIMFQEVLDGPMQVAYVCPECGHEDSIEQEAVKPYTLICKNCEHEIFKQEKKKGKKKKK